MTVLWWLMSLLSMLASAKASGTLCRRTPINRLSVPWVWWRCELGLLRMTPSKKAWIKSATIRVKGVILCWCASWCVSCIWPCSAPLLKSSNKSCKKKPMRIYNPASLASACSINNSGKRCRKVIEKRYPPENMSRSLKEAGLGLRIISTAMPPRDAARNNSKDWKSICKEIGYGLQM